MAIETISLPSSSGGLGRPDVDPHLRRLQQRVVNRAVLDHLRESLAPIRCQGRRLHREVDLADSIRIRGPPLVARDGEPLSRRPVPAQEPCPIEGDAARKASQKQLGRGGGGVVPPILDRLVGTKLMTTGLYQEAISTLVRNADARCVGTHQMKSVIAPCAWAKAMVAPAGS